MPCLDILISLFLTPGARLGKTIGTKNTILVMVIFHIISYIILIFATKFYMVILAISIFGLGMGLSTLTFMRNCWKYFPNNRGFVNGVIISSSGILSTFLTILADYFIINPNKEETINGIYPESVSFNVPIYVKRITCIMICIDIIGFLLTFDYDQIAETKEEEVKRLNEMKRGSLDTVDTNAPNESISLDSDNINLNNIEQKKIKIREAFFSKTNMKLLSFCFCGFCKYYIFKYFSS